MDYCYLCGTRLVKKKNRSKDHIPPACIFPLGTQPMITVPCCINCNSKYKLLDEKMRNFIATLSSDTSCGPIEKAKRAILKSPKLVKQYLAYTKPHPTLKNSTGRPRLLFYFKKHELEKWLIRIVKGLYYHENGKIISKKAIYEVKFMSEIIPPQTNIFPMEKGLERRPYFVYGVIKEINLPNTDFWVFVFYDRLVFSITVEIPA